MNLWASPLPAFEKLPRPVPTDGSYLLVGFVPLPDFFAAPIFIVVAMLAVSLIVPLLMLEMLPKSEAISFF